MKGNMKYVTIFMKIKNNVDYFYFSKYCFKIDGKLGV